MCEKIKSISIIRFRTFVILLTFILCAQIQAAGARGVRGGGMPVPERIVQDFNSLKTESLEQSIKNLYLVDFYYWPGRLMGGGGGGSTLPLPETIGQVDIDSIFRNLRFLKVYDELSQIQSNQASKLIIDQINETLPLYTRMFSNSWDRVFKVHENQPRGNRYTAGPSLQISDDPNGTPTLAGVRFKLLSLVVLAGNFKLENTKPAIASVVSEALAQRKKFYDPNSGFESDRFSMLTKAGIYNRQALATGILLTSGSQTQADAKSTGNEESRWESRQLARYQPSAISPYDMLRINPSGGVIDARIHKPLDDEEFDKICIDYDYERHGHFQNSDEKNLTK